MTSPDRDTALVREATGRLLTSAAALDDDAVRGPSLLPGWTRGHVLTHLARNADALLEVLAGRPMYASAEARDADIETGAPRPLAEQLDDLRTASSRLDGAFAAQGATAWERTVALRKASPTARRPCPSAAWSRSSCTTST
jgi:maleylpyruvate isomerase